MAFEVNPIKYIFGNAPKDEVLERLSGELEERYNKVAEAGGRIVATHNIELDDRTRALLVVSELPKTKKKR